jgi:Tol biopolymer transport system component
LLFLRDGALLAQPFDVDRLRVSGEPEPIAQNVLSAPNNGRVAFAVSDSGAMAHRSGGETSPGESQIWAYDRSGKRLEPIGEPMTDLTSLRLSPDEKRLAIVRGQGVQELANRTSDIWILDLARASIPTRFTFNPEHRNGNPSWSADGTRLAYSSSINGAASIQVKAADGRREAQAVSTSPLDRFPTDWSLDGRVLHYYEAEPASKNDLWILPVDAGAAPRPFLRTPFNEVGGFLSPDGRWVAYQSNEGGASDVYVCAFPACDRKQRISVGGGDYPQWRRDGRELFYVAQTTLMAVEVSSGEDLQPGVPKPLFDTRMLRNMGNGQYAVAANGQRFLIYDVASTRSAPITVVLNWPAALKR